MNNIAEYGVEEVSSPLTLFGVRIVKFVSPYEDSKILVFGVPPWRILQPSDFHNKLCVEVK